MPNVVAELRQWSNSLPYWEQAALDQIANKKPFAETDYARIMGYLLEDAGLADRTAMRPVHRFPTDFNGGQPREQSPHLVKLANLQNVNALVPGQVLSFGDGITAIYGANGSGKSGYARVLGCAGFTRGDREVLPDVTQPVGSKAVPSADIELSDGSCTSYEVDSQCPQLASYYAFDSTSVQCHLGKENALSFSPAGLCYLSELARVTDVVRARLQDAINAYQCPHDFPKLFQGDSEASRMVAQLGSDTDLVKVKQLGSLSPADSARLEKLDLEVAGLKSEKVPEKIGQLQLTISDLGSLGKRLHAVLLALGEDVWTASNKEILRCNSTQVAAQSVSADQFKSDRFVQLGTEVWHEFVKAAKALAEREQDHGEPYPQDRDICLLCHQQLSREARDLLVRLWAYLEADAQAQLMAARQALNKRVTELKDVDLDFFQSDLVSFRYLQENQHVLLTVVSHFMASARSCHDRLLRNIDQLATGQYAQLPGSGMAQINALILSLEEECRGLQARNTSQEIAEREAEMLSIQHRKILSHWLSDIEAYVKHLKWAEKATKASGSTAHITKKHNELFKILVEDRYIELFEKTLSDLKRPLRVRIQTRGQKGSALKQITIECHPTVAAGQATPSKVLSEGEKRAVALADFLTEVSLDDASQGIVLDDPVTSLDIEWKETIADRLAEEGQKRQVIVFTHDLHFLYLLKTHADEQQVPIATHWIKRGDTDGKPGYVFLENTPLMEQSFKKSTRAKDCHDQACKAGPEDQESLLQQGFGALRTSYEAFIIFELFSDVVRRFDDRVSFGRLKDIAWDDAIANEVIKKCELLSRYIEGHSHSDLSSQKKPTPAVLLQEINDFVALTKKLKDLKKHQNKA